MARCAIRLISIDGDLTVSDHSALLNFWKSAGGSRSMTARLISSFRVRKPLTESQFRRLPGELRARVQRG
jgi:hypothetical protein